MKLKKEIQTAWEISVLLHWLSDLLWERYEDDFADMDLPGLDDPCLGPLGPLGSLDTQDKPEG
jgi:hypothetical protein